MGQTFVFLLAILGLLGYFVSKIYNQINRLNSRVERNFSGIDTQLSRRHGVIKKLVSSVNAEQKSIINQFEALTNLVEKANLQRGNQQAFLDTENQISRMWNQILNLPQLQSIRGFQDFNKQIAELEEEIAAARRTYNDSVERFNTYLVSFPTGFIAQLLFKQFQQKAYFQATADERQDYDRRIVCYFKGIVYQMEYEKENLNSDFLTVMIPKKAAPSPTKKIREDRKTITVSKDYPRLELLSRDKRRPERFIQRGFEEYSVENIAMEDNFYVFTNNENASRKLLSYRFMEKIVETISPKKAEISQPKVVQLLLGNQENAPNFWMQFTNITRQNNKPLQKLTVVTTNKNLTFFEVTGEKSCKLDNFLHNFQELENILSSIITALNVVPTAGN